MVVVSCLTLLALSTEAADRVDVKYGYRSGTNSQKPLRESAAQACIDSTPGTATGFVYTYTYWEDGGINPPDGNFNCHYTVHSQGVLVNPDFNGQNWGFSWTYCPSGDYVQIGLMCTSSWPWATAKNPPDSCSASTPKTKQPISLTDGNKFLAETDYQSAVPAGVEFVRYYNSMVGSQWVARRMGEGWRDSYQASISVYVVSATTYAQVRPSQGASIEFRSTDGGVTWLTDADVTYRLIKLTNGWQVTRPDDAVETYDSAGKLVQTKDRAGRQRTITYDASGRMASVSDAFGRTLSFAYNADGRIAAMTDPDARQTTYAYDASGRLTSVTYPDNKTRTYHYENATFPKALTGITDENGVRFITYGYDASGYANSESMAGGAENYSMVYGLSSTSVNTPLGASVSLGFSKILNVNRLTSASQPYPACGVTLKSASYDANGNIARRTDFNNNATCHTYDLTRNLETKRVEGLSGTTCPGTSGPATRTISTQWHASFRLPTAIAEPKRITSYSYDSYGNLVSKSIQATTDTTGAAGFSATPTGTARTWTYTHTYHPSLTGFITQTVVNGPRTDVVDTTTIAYDSIGGGLASVTNALGHVTSYSNVDVHGRARRITDPNGLITDLIYDLRGRLTSRTTGTEVTTYEYDGVGQLTKVTLPDSSTLSYTYDNAHRLTQLQDNLGNKVVYTLDAMGNRLAENVSDPSGTLARKRQREYNNLNRLTKDIGGASPTTEITQYAYDTQGNLTTITDPLSKVTTQQYDALNRLIKTIEPAASGAGAGGNIQYAYDGLDQLTQVTDPRSLATTYTLDGLGRLTTQVSPDTGTTTKTFDAAGNVLTQTDARNVVASFTYDALDRLASATYTPPGGSGIAAVSLTYSYDAGTYGKGKLTGFTDPSGSTSTVYDQKGRLSSETRTIAGVASTTQYTYDSAGRLSRLTYPSGRTVDYSYDAGGRVSAFDTTAGGVTQSVVGSVTYHPFGTVKSLLFGNATPYSRSFDLSGRISGYTLANLSRTVGFDAASRITGFTHNNAAFDQTFGYDNLSRITSWTGLSTNQSFAYDLTGNRTNLGIGASSYPYTVQPTSNRVTQTAGPGGAKSFGFDTAGNTTSAGSLTFGYDARGRMISANTALGPVTYQVNALGQRVAKTVGGVTTRYHFDANGNLIGESGTTTRDYAWLGSLPVAILEGSSAYFVHNDHLDTPRVVTNAANTIIWRWDSDPFGFFPAAEDPDGNSQLFTLNLRFPGQYFDKETNLHYNYFRDYDPQIGRYVQSDPIGLDGGINAYAYAWQSPVRYSDALGLRARVVDPLVIVVPRVQNPASPGGYGTGDPRAAYPCAGGWNSGQCYPSLGPDPSSDTSAIEEVARPYTFDGNACAANDDDYDKWCKREKRLLDAKRDVLWAAMAAGATNAKVIIDFNNAVKRFNERCKPMRVEPLLGNAK